ncbi:hypothetical protein AVEN_83078-1 [Araneus ventricosus]|uniref:Uncharacterized protein n=1 Tax=Araneus ventricosus TaxID=182803 RepID=A0A4Y2AP13_ARAVE|nr:hypothetical protein AVEN_83078-1 [Araneus ventricosus]
MNITLQEFRCKICRLEFVMTRQYPEKITLAVNEHAIWVHDSERKFIPIRRDFQDDVVLTQLQTHLPRLLKSCLTGCLNERSHYKLLTMAFEWQCSSHAGTCTQNAPV